MSCTCTITWCNSASKKIHAPAINQVNRCSIPRRPYICPQHVNHSNTSTTIPNRAAVRLVNTTAIQRKSRALPISTAVRFTCGSEKSPLELCLNISMRAGPSLSRDQARIGVECTIKTTQLPRSRRRKSCKSSTLKIAIKLTLISSSKQSTAIRILSPTRNTDRPRLTLLIKAGRHSRIVRT